MSKHTPGPWKKGSAKRLSDIPMGFPRSDGPLFPSIVHAKSNTFVALIPRGSGWGALSKVEMATVELIVAAPELLAAAKGITEMLAENWGDGVAGGTVQIVVDADVLQAICEAVAKAEGKR